MVLSRKDQLVAETSGILMRFNNSRGYLDTRHGVADSIIERGCSPISNASENIGVYSVRVSWSKPCIQIRKFSPVDPTVLRFAYYRCLSAPTDKRPFDEVASKVSV